MYKTKYNFIDNTIEKVTNIEPHDIIVLQTQKGIILNNAPKILVKELKKHKADFVYCDEVGSYKPDWSADTLRSYNYISGIIAFTGELFINAGLTNIQPTCCYDLIFRLTEKAKKIIHTNKILFAPSENTNAIDENLEKKALQERFKQLLNKVSCNKKTKVFIAMHKDYITPYNEIFETVQCGCNLTNTRLNCKHFDNCGENISAKNKNYCELTALYAMWKNGKFENYDYVGLMHYRRYLYPFNQPFNSYHNFFSLLQNCHLEKIFCSQLFSGKKNTHWENPAFAFTEISTFLENEMYNFDMLVPYPEILPCSVYRHYCYYHREKDLQAMIKSVEKLFPDFLPYLKKALNSHSLYIGNLFVMQKSLTNEYLSMLFTVLEDVEKKIILPTDTYQARVFGFLAERLFSAFVLYCKSQKIKIRHAWILNIKN